MPESKEEVMTAKTTPASGWRLWLLWKLATVAGFIVGIGASVAALGMVHEMVASVAFGVVFGLLQWLILRRYVGSAGWWIMASALAAPLGLAAANTVHRATLWAWIPAINGALGFAVFGLVVGLVQWLVLDRVVRRSGWWVTASAVGWCVGGFASWVLGVRLPENLKVIADFSIIGATAGAATGLALVLLLRHPAPERMRGVSLPGSALVGVLGLALIVLTLVSGASDRRHGGDLGLVPEPDPTPTCSNVPQLDCAGGGAYCAELVPFEPVAGPGYTNYPLLDETWDNQYRSYLRRDLMAMAKYASARVACGTESWGSFSSLPVGLGDMSEADGSIPGTSTGHPDHPQGTHRDGRDIDIAYYQRETQSLWLRLEHRWLGAQGSLLRSVCKHTRFGVEVNHCTGAPRLLDPWRTALFIAYAAEHPLVRVIGVDGQVGPVLERALDGLAGAGWVDAGAREDIPLAYEATYEGLGWYQFHNDHLHISFEEGGYD
jgi:hypothetical protein